MCRGMATGLPAPVLPASVTGTPFIGRFPFRNPTVLRVRQRLRSRSRPRNRHNPRGWVDGEQDRALGQATNPAVGPEKAKVRAPHQRIRRDMMRDGLSVVR